MNELPTSTAMAFLNTINQHPGRKRQPLQEGLATLINTKEAIEKECRAYAKLAIPDQAVHSAWLAQLDRQLSLTEIDRQLEQQKLDKTKFERSRTSPTLTIETSTSHRPDPPPEPTETQPQGDFSVRSILSSPWSKETTAATTIATHLDALHHAATHTATREATSKAMKFLLSHARDSRDSPSCPPCMIMREILEQHQSEHMRPFRQATAGVTTPCLANLVELCNNVIESKSANPHSKRRACLTNASACFTLRDQLSSYRNARPRRRLPRRHHPPARPR